MVSILCWMYDARTQTSELDISTLISNADIFTQDSNSDLSSPTCMGRGIGSSSKPSYQPSQCSTRRSIFNEGFGTKSSRLVNSYHLKLYISQGNFKSAGIFSPHIYLQPRNIELFQIDQRIKQFCKRRWVRHHPFAVHLYMAINLKRSQVSQMLRQYSVNE